MTTDAVFWTKLAPKYARSSVADVPAYEHTLARTRSYLREDDRVLELGCGTGSTALRLADAAAEIVATDFADGMIRIARDKAAAADVQNVEFRVADTGLDGFKPERFDAVLAFNLFHLVTDLDAALGRAREVLKPGGYLISKTVCMRGAWYLVPLIRILQLVGKAPFVAMLSPDELRAKMEARGFEIVETAHHNKSTRGYFVVARKA